MTRQRDCNSMWTTLGSLGWPVLLGLAASTAFYSALQRGLLGTEFLPRYCAAHPILYCEVGLFFVGSAALAVKIADLCGQLHTIQAIGFGVPQSGSVPVEGRAEMLAELDRLPSSARRSYLGCRLSEALEFLERAGHADGLDEELRYLSDADKGRQRDSYGLVRTVIWATPMLGLLGTIVGITQALGDLDPKLLVSNSEHAVQGLLAGVCVAFDTSSLALTLSMALVFGQFFAERVETQLLSIVGGRAHEELSARLEVAGTSRDPQVASIQRMAREVLQTNEKLVARQSEHWRVSIDTLNEKWSQSTRVSAEQVRNGLTEALEQSLHSFAGRLAQSEATASDQAGQRWEQWQTALSTNARMMQAQQQEISRQSELMARIVEATGDVIKLETSLNQNLKALAGSQNFEDTVMSLAAVIHLLNTRLGAIDTDTRRVDLTQPKVQGRAA